MAVVSANMENIPKGVLETIPASTPPVGVQSNLHTSPQGGQTAVIASSVFCALAAIAFTNRIFTKAFVLRKTSWDDLTCFIGILVAILVWAFLIRLLIFGPIGKHRWDVSVAEILGHNYTIPSWIQQAFDSVSLLFIKLTFLLQYLQIFWPLRWLRMCVYLAAPLTAGFYGAVSIGLMALATPHHGETWAQHQLSPSLNKELPLTIPVASVGLAIDLFLLILPVKAVMQLQMPTKKKFGVMLVFMTGLLACVCCTLNLYYRVLMWRTGDFTFYETPVFLMQAVERFVGTICVCMPSFATILKHLRSQVWTRPLRLQSQCENIGMDEAIKQRVARSSAYVGISLEGQRSRVE